MFQKNWYFNELNRVNGKKHQKILIFLQLLEKGKHYNRRIRV